MHDDDDKKGIHNVSFGELRIWLVVMSAPFDEFSRDQIY